MGKIKKLKKPLSNKAEALDGLMLSIGESIFHGAFANEHFEMAFHHITLLAQEINRDLAEIVKLGFDEKKEV